MDEAKLLISKGKIKDATSIILNSCMNTKHEKSAFIISSRYENLINEKRKGVVSHEIFQLRHNQIVDDLLELIEVSNEKSKKNLKINSKKKYETNRIVLLSLLIISIVLGAYLIINYSNLNIPTNELKSCSIKLIDVSTNQQLKQNNTDALLKIVKRNSTLEIPIIDGEAIFLKESKNDELVELKLLNIDSFQILESNKNVKLVIGINEVKVKRINNFLNPKDSIIQDKDKVNNQKIKSNILIVSGIVIDEQSNPISDVKLYSSDLNLMIKSSLNGKFSLELKNPKTNYIRLYAEKSEYSPWNDYINIPNENLVVKLLKNRK